MTGVTNEEEKQKGGYHMDMVARLRVGYAILKRVKDEVFDAPNESTPTGDGLGCKLQRWW